MLRIRRKQMDTLDALARAAFVRQATATVASWEAPRLAGLTAAQLRAWVEERIDRALALGVEDDAWGLLAWLEVAADHGDALAEDALVVNLINAPDARAEWGERRALIDAEASGKATAMEQPS